MALITGTGRQIAYNKETSWAVPNATTYTIIRTPPGADSNIERSQIQTAELNARRAVTSIRMGSHRPTVTIPPEMFYAGVTAGAQQFNDFVESWMFNAWTAAASPIAAQTVTVGTPAATTVFTAGTSVTGIAQGDWIKVAGFTGAQVGNNGYFRVVSVASLALTLATPRYDLMVAGAAGGTAVTLTRVSYISPGTTVKSLAFDETFTDFAGSITASKLSIGCLANEFSMNMAPDQPINLNFSFPGRVMGVGANRAAAATAASQFSTISAPTAWTAAATYSPMTGNDVLMQLMVDNAKVGTITALSFTGTNNLEQLMPIGQIYPYFMGQGTSSLSGSLTVFMEDSSYWTKYMNETAVGISIQLMDPDNGTPTTQAAGLGYAIDIPNVKLTGLSSSTSQTNIALTLNWQAIENAVASTKGASTVNMRVSHLA